jgi:hypothetical protein
MQANTSWMYHVWSPCMCWMLECLWTCRVICNGRSSVRRGSCSEFFDEREMKVRLEAVAVDMCTISTRCYKKSIYQSSDQFSEVEFGIATNLAFCSACLGNC